MQTRTLTSSVQSISEFVGIVNDMLKSCHTNIYPDGKPPYIFFQPENRLFYLVIPELYIISPDDIQVLMNETLYTYFSGFPASDEIISGKLYKQIRVYDIPDDGLNYQPPPLRWTGTGYARKIPAEYPSDFRFNDLQAVIVTSNIQVRNEWIPLKSTNNNISYISTLPVLTDFRPVLERYGQQNSSLMYYPSSEYRWIDLLYDGPIDRLSFAFWWQSMDQQLHRILLAPGESVSIKLYFRSIY